MTNCFDPRNGKIQYFESSMEIFAREESCCSRFDLIKGGSKVSHVFFVFLIQCRLLKIVAAVQILSLAASPKDELRADIVYRCE